MPGHAAASGSALGGFIEGVTGGFERTTEFKRRRRLEQQVAEQLSAKNARQGVVDANVVEDREIAAEDREREHRFKDFEFFRETGFEHMHCGAVPGAVQEVPDAVLNLRGAVGQELPKQVVSPTATPQPGADPQAGGAGSLLPGFTKTGLSADEREAEQRSGILAKVGEFMALSPEEREAALQDPETQRALDELGIFDNIATAPAPGSSVRFGVTGTGGRTITGATRPQADAFAEDFPPTPRTPSDLSVPQAFKILKDGYARFEDDGTFIDYEKPDDVILTEARALARGGEMAPRPPQPEEEKGPGFLERLGQSKAAQFALKVGQTITPGGDPGFLSPKTPESEVPAPETPQFTREETQLRVRELEDKGISPKDILQIMQSEGYNIQ